MQRPVILAAVALAALVSAGCSSSASQPAASSSAPVGSATSDPGAAQTPSPAPTPTQASFGTPVPATAEGGATATITVTGPKYAQSDGVSSPQNGSYDTFVVHIVNTGAGTFPYGSGSFSVQGQDGREYDVDGSADSQLDVNQELNPSGQITGNVTFDAPTHGTLMFTPDGSAVDTIEWRF